MGIGNISDYGSMLQSYRMPSIPSVDVNEAALQSVPEERSRIPDTPVSVTEEQPAAVHRQAEALKLEDVSLSLKGNEAFEMTGRDSDISGLDIRKAVSDMKKDSILEQYQFFVGSSQNILQNNIEPDGIVIAKL